MLCKRLNIENDSVRTAVDSVRRALHSQFQKKGRGAAASPHEALGVITEEVRELELAVHQNDKQGVIAECTDIAVAALWVLSSVEEAGRR